MFSFIFLFSCTEIQENENRLVDQQEMIEKFKTRLNLAENLKIGINFNEGNENIDISGKGKCKKNDFIEFATKIGMERIKNDVISNNRNKHEIFEILAKTYDVLFKTIIKKNLLLLLQSNFACNHKNFRNLLFLDFSPRIINMNETILKDFYYDEKFIKDVFDIFKNEFDEKNINFLLLRHVFKCFMEISNNFVREFYVVAFYKQIFRNCILSMPSNL